MKSLYFNGFLLGSLLLSSFFLSPFSAWSDEAAPVCAIHRQGKDMVFSIGSTEKVRSRLYCGAVVDSLNSAVKTNLCRPDWRTSIDAIQGCPQLVDELKDKYIQQLQQDLARERDQSKSCKSMLETTQERLVSGEKAVSLKDLKNVVNEIGQWMSDHPNSATSATAN